MNLNNDNFRITLEYKDIFDDEPLSVIDYLKNINKELLLKAITGLNSFYDLPLREFIQQYFTKADHEIKFKILNYYNFNYDKINYSIFNKYNTLFLLENAIELSSCDTKNSDSEIGINILKAILIINQEKHIKEHLINEVQKQTTDETYIYALCLTQTFPYSEIENFNPKSEVICQMIKVVKMFDFLLLSSD